MKYFAWTLICLLVVLHQCTLPWQSETLWLGFLPNVLAYHLLSCRQPHALCLLVCT